MLRPLESSEDNQGARKATNGSLRGDVTAVCVSLAASSSQIKPSSQRLSVCMTQSSCKRWFKRSVIALLVRYRSLFLATLYTAIGHSGLTVK